MEQTFVMVKPDGVKRRMIGEIIKRFEKKGLYLADIKVMNATVEILEKHYVHLKDKPFFKFMVKDMMAGVVVPMVFEGENAVNLGRQIIGATNPAEAATGSIRGDLCMSVAKNAVHGSDSVENAKKEILLWFGREVKAVEGFENHLLFE